MTTSERCKRCGTDHRPGTNGYHQGAALGNCCLCFCCTVDALRCLCARRKAEGRTPCSCAPCLEARAA